MKIRLFHTAAVAAALLTSLSAFADGGAGTDYSPYSKFGIGTLAHQGTSYNLGMGGVGIAGRDNRFLNILNPAAVTARDTLAFMADFSVAENNAFYSQGDIKSAHNTFNIKNFAMSFPIWKSSAFMIGICPFSSVGYKVSSIEKNPEVIGNTGNISDVFEGTGDIYQLYLGAGVTFWKRLSIGAQFNYYFGNLEKYSSRTFASSKYRSIYSGTQMTLQGFNGKFGLQYEQPIGKGKLIAGATCRIPTTLIGSDVGAKYPNGKIDVLTTSVQSDVVDTLVNKAVAMGAVSIPLEFAVGLSYRQGDKWSVEVNYTRSDWTKSNMDNVTGFSLNNFGSNVAQSFNAGFEIVPNRSDIRYYLRRCAYRAGGYYSTEYYNFKGNKVTSYGVTLGITFPVFRWYNGVTLGFDFGRRGSMQSDMVLERYIGINASLNVFDIWFVKHRYE